MQQETEIMELIKERWGYMKYYKYDIKGDGHTQVFGAKYANSIEDMISHIMESNELEFDNVPGKMFMSKKQIEQSYVVYARKHETNLKHVITIRIGEER